MFQFNKRELKLTVRVDSSVSCLLNGGHYCDVPFKLEGVAPLLQRIEVRLGKAQAVHASVFNSLGSNLRPPLFVESYIRFELVMESRMI